MRADFVVEGLSPLEAIPDHSVGEIIYRSLSTKQNEDSALIDSYSDQTVSYYELLTKSCSLAEVLRGLGCGSNTTIAVCSKNSLEYFIPVIASLYVGATVVTINPSYTYNELLHITCLSKPKIIFCSRDLLYNFSIMRLEVTFIERLVIIGSEKSSLGTKCLKEFIGRNTETQITRFVTTPVNAKEHIAFILCSSGTTGLPKGVMLTDRNINAIFTHFRDSRIHNGNPITFCAVPFFHAYGLFVVLANLTKQCPTIFSPSFELGLILKSIQAHRVTRLLLVPSIIVILTKCLTRSNYDLSSVKEVLSSAAPLDRRTEDAFRKRMKSVTIRQGYGLTEVSHFSTFNGIDNSLPKSGSTGKVLPFVKVAVKDLKTGECLGPKKCGEICIKGDTVMKGYLDNPEANKEAFTLDGWFRTGDIGYYDEDEHFFITDRIKDLIKYKGYQVAPAELEAVLLTHPEIIEAAVISVPDEVAGELPMALVVKSKTSKIPEKEVQDFVKGQLSPQKWLRGGVIFVETIPKNGSGKILRKKMRQMYVESCMSKL